MYPHKVARPAGCCKKNRVSPALIGPVMSIPYPWLLGFAIMVLLLVLGATSGLVNSKLWISEPLVCAAFGVALGPFGAGLLRLDASTSPQAHDFLREAARVTLAIAVLAGALRLPKGWLREHWRGLAVALGPGMLLMWAAGAALAYLCLGLPPLICLLVGAIIAPTDPVLSAPVVSGELAQRAVPGNLRHAITAESSINDGLAGPFVALPVALLTVAGGIGPELGDWLLHAALWQAGSAVVVGATAGYAASLLLHWANRLKADRSSLLTIALALALATLTGLQAIDGNGVLGSFVAGAVLNERYKDDYQEHQEHFNEAITRFFDLPIMIFLGVAAPWHAWISMGWRAPAFAVCVLLLRRIPAWLLLRRFMPWARSVPENLFAGWFGPIGAAAMFYALEAQDQTGLNMLWPIVSLVAAASVVTHGLTGTHFSAMLGHRLGRRPP
jgi:NhaP-type Na+/H+ or K+/H+ antiporter